MECRAGSYLYGTNTVESDIDTRGVFIADSSCYLGLDKIEQIESKVNDTVHYELKKFTTLAMANNPNIIELLFVPLDRLTICSDEWLEIIKHRDWFVSLKCKYTFTGYAFSQLKKIKQLSPEDLENSNNKYKDLYLKVGYNTKNALHLFRLMQEGEELLSTGNITLPRPNADELLGIKNGSMTYDEVLNYAKTYELKYEQLYNNSKLQHYANYKMINELVQKIIKENI